MFLIFFICILKTIIKINKSATVIYRSIVNNAVTSTLHASLLRYTYIACLVTFYFIFLTPDGDPFAAVTTIVCCCCYYSYTTAKFTATTNTNTSSSSSRMARVLITTKL